MLAIMPMLAMQADALQQAAGDAGHTGVISALPGWQQALVVAALIGAIIVGGQLLIRPAFRFIAATQMREIFTAAALSQPRPCCW